AVADRDVVLHHHQLGDLGRALGRLVDHPVGAGDADWTSGGVDLGRGSGHGPSVVASPDRKAVPGSGPYAGAMGYQVEKTDQEWREQLSREEYAVLRRAGTERAFTGEYTDTKTVGVYRCRACQAELFKSETKFDS